MRRRSVLYAVVHADGRVTFGHSPRPEVDRQFWLATGAQRLVPLGPWLPPVWAELACRGLAAGKAAPPSFHSWLAQRLGHWLGRGRRPRQTQPRWEEAVRQATLRARQLLQVAGYDWAAQPGLRAFAADGLLRELVDDAPFDDITRNDITNDTTNDTTNDITNDTRHAASVGSLPSPAALDAVTDLLRGRLLTGAEVARQVAQAAVPLDRPLEEYLTWLVLRGRIHRWPGVYPAAFGGFRCSRCGETDQVRPWDCAACGERECWRCEACRSLGLVSGCVFLYAGGLDAPMVAARDDHVTVVTAMTRSAPASTVTPQTVAKQRPVAVRLPALTPAQRRAAWSLEAFVRQGERREALVWAVCGAGKTEVTFIAASRVLARGGRVLFAVPRRDVVQELGPRLAAAFPGVELRVLHGGPDRVDRPGLAPGSLTIATTYQVLRFHRAFDLAILDEVDAFPYRGSPMLARAMDRAVRPGGWIIRMSATPDDALIQQARSGKSVLVPIPARYHGHPLPVPEILVDRALVPGGEDRERPYRPSELVLSLVHRSLAGTPPARLLVFVPTIALAEQVGRGMADALAANGWGGQVGWSHARDPARERKRRAFLDGQLRLLVATTILERGITVPDVDVIVLFSDVEHIFQTSVLVQMAGRVGRTIARPTGRVAFVGRRITRAMRAAVAQIQEMNQLARQMGLLKG